MRAGRTWIVLLGMPIAGCLLGYALGALSTADIRWINLGSPPDPPAQLLGVVRSGSEYRIHVKSQSGRAFSCCHADPEWLEIQPASEYRARRCGEVQPPFPVPSPPAGVVACTEYDPGFEALGFETRRFVLLQDGSVWTWQRGGGLLGPAANLAGLGLLAGAIAALVSGVKVLTPPADPAGEA
jgi:hypothetical protein